MKKKFIIWLSVSEVIMLVLPWVVVSFVPGDAGMAACFLLFYIVNPVFSVIIGIFAGKSFEDLWSLPIISMVLFLLGVWLFFEIRDTEFIIYAAAYLVLGGCAMMISMLRSKREQ